MMVPGSPFPSLDHYFSWYAIVREKEGAKKKYCYWINGNQINRQAVADHLRIYFRNVEVLEIQKCTKMPEKVLNPIPSRHFNFGLLDGPEDGFTPEDEEQEALWRPGEDSGLGNPLWSRQSRF